MHSTGSPAVRAALEAVELDRFGAYVWARAAVLGDPSPDEVVAAFAVFEPGALRSTHVAARAACSRTTLLATRTETTIRSLRATLGVVAVDDVAAGLRRALLSAPAAGRPLFTGLAGLPWPSDPIGQLWRACELLREHRGDTHRQVCDRYDLGPVERNVLTELWLGMPLGSYTRTRGWDGRALAAAVDRLVKRHLIDGAALTEGGRALRDAVEAETDAGEEEVVRALGAQLEPVITALDRWSTLCIQAGTFTSDGVKRAAG